jgi:ABC-2 type transport system ATP-binding protein
MNSLIELSQITHFYGEVCALTDVSVEVGPGAVGLIGQNGAGKSTMMQILLGLIQPTQGTARVLDQDVRDGGLQLRGRVGYMPEREVLIPGLRGVEFVALAGELSGLSRRQAKRRAHETLSYLGLEEARYRKLEQYSVGMTQRLKLAATLVHDPDVLLLDEPTAGLDAAGRSAMLRLLCTLAARPNKSLIMSSHLLGDIERVCTSAIIVDQGQVVGRGRLEDLRARQQRSYRIHWIGNATLMLKALQSMGATTATDSRHDEASVVVPDQWKTRTFFELAKQHSLVLTGLSPELEDLGATYRRLISEGRTHRHATDAVHSGGTPA